MAGSVRRRPGSLASDRAEPGAGSIRPRPVFSPQGWEFSALGTALGLWNTREINWIEAFLTRVTGAAVFPRDVYYFKEIPTNVDPGSVALVNLGAVVIAVVFSLLPAYRAARLHPVRALRFE